MGKCSRQVEYFVTSLILFGAGMIFFFMNGSIGTYTALRFSLLQILESLAVFVTGILLTYQAYLESRQENTVDSGENGAENTKAGQEIKEAAESVNATVALLLVAGLVRQLLPVLSVAYSPMKLVRAQYQMLPLLPLFLTL